MSGQDMALFASPAEVYAARVDAWWAAHVWLGRYRWPRVWTVGADPVPVHPEPRPAARQPVARGVRPPRPVLLDATHDHPAGPVGIEAGRPLWADASMTLRKMAAALQGARR